VGKFAPKIGGNKEPELVGSPKAPSAGGEGEVKSLDSVSFVPKKSFNKVVEQIVNQVTPKLLEIIQNTADDDIDVMRSMVSESFFSEEDLFEVNSIVANIIKNKSLGLVSFDDVIQELRNYLESDGLDVGETLMFPLVDEFEETMKSGLSGYIGKTILFTLNDIVFTQSVIGDDGEVQYNSIVEQVQEKMKVLLPEYVKSYVGIEFERLINKIKENEK
jgi:hypothetical protein